MAAKVKRPSLIEQRINALPEDLRDRVWERAAILWEVGDVSDDEANMRAFELETGQAMKGLARASTRTEEAPDSTGKATGNG